MQPTEQLRAAGVATFPCWARYNKEKGRWDKGPAVPKGESWAITATRPYDDPILDWSSGVIGIPIPDKVLVLDLDSYKGVTRQAVEAFLGCTLPWEAAMLQHTIGGGEHYAFQCNWDARQGDSIGLVGLDTRVAGKGFICSGQGYTPVGFGVFALAYPEALPTIPDEARTALERSPPVKPVSTSTTEVTADVDQIMTALRHVDPGCSRTEWRNIGYALKAIFVEDEGRGYEIFEEWSAGEYSSFGTPVNYVPEGQGSTLDQWATFKADGGVKPATLFYYAIEAGWQPPASFDTSAAFGPGAAPVDTFNALADRIRQDGCDITSIQPIIDEIRNAGCNSLQVALLAAELKTQLRESGLKDKAVAEHIDSLLKTQTHQHSDTPADQYGKSDPANALLFLSRFYPNDTLVRCDGEFYRYTGKIWEKISEDVLKHQIAVDMAQFGAQTSRIEAATKLGLRITSIKDGQMNTQSQFVIVFNNGILNPETGHLTPHDQMLLSTNLLPYNWSPGTPCNHWLAFLNDVFDGDGERISLLQEWLGYMMIQDYSHHKIMFLLGPLRSGKGTIGRVLQYIVGAQNFSGGSLSSFASDSFLATLRTKPVVFIGDAEKRIASNKVNQVIVSMKTISGNDEVAFDRKFLSGLSETLPSRITIASNSIPNLFDDSGALASRLLVLPFYKSYYNREDLHLSDKLLGEIEGIAAWAIEGWRRLKANGRFTCPAISEEETRFIKEAYSPLLRFISECCDVESEAECSSTELYECYRAWALNESEDLVRPKTLTGSLRDALRSAGVVYGVHRFKDGKRARGFKGLRVKRDAPSTASAFVPTVVK